MVDRYSNLHNKKVLIVEDDDLLRHFMEKEFILQEMICFNASNLIEALNLLNKNVFDLVLSDINMQGGSGVDLVKKLHETHASKKPKIIFMSGYAEFSTLELKKMGVDQLISKPFGVNEIFKVMSELLT